MLCQKAGSGAKPQLADLLVPEVLKIHLKREPAPTLPLHKDLILLRSRDTTNKLTAAASQPFWGTQVLIHTQDWQATLQAAARPEVEVQVAS